jgi:trimeric autotransporter adhesin
MMAKSHLLSVRLTLFLVLCALVALPAIGQVAKQSGTDVLSSLAFVHEKLQVSDPIEPLDNARAFVSPTLQNNWEAYRIGLGTTTRWDATIDRRTGLISFAEGGNVSWVPGRGNKLTTADLGGVLKGKPQVDMGVMETIARGYLPRVQAFLGVDPKDLVLNRGRSGQPADHLWFVDFDVVRDGLTVEGARVVFRVNNGNLIQYGTEGLPAPGAKVPVAKLTQKDALDAVAQLIGGFQVGDTFRDAGSLHLLPVAVVNNKLAERFEFGKGRDLAKVWQFVFHRDGVMGTWRARVDAATGEVLELADINDYVAAQATGGTYLNSPTTGSEVVRPMPFTNLSTGGFANSAGLYNFTSGALTSTLNGQYVAITDTCGAISKTADAAGNLAFGTSTGTDCITPGSGGAGNTHASREQFYQVNRIKEVGRGWLPSNTWLQAKLTVNVNLNQTCNAYWNGSSLNFFKSGGGCRNTGELAGVSLHEYGHGLDQNDGTGTAPEGGTGEAYGDITAAIALHTSCIGPGFLTTQCSGYGNACTACTGVRDIDSAKRVTTTPATVSNFTQVRCGAGSGPCGKEVHCESYVPSQTIWDLANRDLPGAGTGPAWTILDRLWYVSRNTATSSFTCNATGTFTSNGCGTGNWWKVMRAVDDDDGNLTNGTPHGAALFAAFNRHGIACTTDTGASTSFSGCTAPAVPTLSITPGNNSAALSWTASGSAVYGVFRNEAGCNAGFAKISGGSTATSLNDVNVGNGLTYFYQVTAYPSGNEACASAPSTCISVTPTVSTTPDFTIAASPASVSIAQGGSGSSTVTTAVSGGFNSAIALSASGLPAGVTASFSPSSIAAPGSGSSTLTFTVSSTATLGTSTVTITGTGGSTTHTTTVSLTVTSVPTPNFAISASPASVSIAKGAAGSSTISSIVSGGFNSAVALSASGQPTGVTVSFSPSSIAAPGSGSSTMTITVASTAVAGTSTITVTGTGGALTRTTTVTLTVTNGGITQLLGNPGFENGSGSPAPWTTTAGVIDSSASEAAHSGLWKAWLNGYGTTHTDSILQTVAIPSTATTATLAFWLHIDTSETTTITAFDTLRVQIRNTSGTVLSTLATYSNLNKATGFTQKSFDVTAFKGQTVQVFLVGTEDSSLQTSFVVDDFTLNVQ